MSKTNSRVSIISLVPVKKFLLLTKLGVRLGSLVILFLHLWKRLNWLREPKWVKEAAFAPKPSLLSFVVGTVLPYVTKGDLCQRFKGESSPNVLRLPNGLGGGFMRDFILVKDPEIATQILLENDTKKPSKGYNAFKRLTGYRGSCDFLSARSHENPIYKRNRTLVYQTLMERTYKHFDFHFIKTVESFISRLEAKKSKDVNVVSEMHQIATSLITRVGFDEHSDNYDKNLFTSAIWIIEDMLRRPQNNAFKFLDDIPTARNFELKKRQYLLVSTIEKMINNKRQQVEQSANGQYFGDDIISVLLKDPQNKAADLLGILSIFFFAGFDTTSNAMTLILHYLATNPEIQKNCREEIQKLCGERPPKIQELFQFNQLQAVIKETLRLHPTVPMVTREVTETHTSTGVCPRFQEKDTFGVTINFIGLQCNPKGWTSPLKFLPKRWLDKSVDAEKDQKKRVFCPFALGKRACLGRQFAMIEMLTVVSMILQKFVVTPKQGSSPNIVESGTLNVDSSFQLKFTKLKELQEKKNSFLSETQYTRSEVARHNTAKDCWVVYKSGVYNLTQYTSRKGEKMHPGGNAVILAMAGGDITSEFDFLNHSKIALSILANCRIGRLTENEKEIIPETSLQERKSFVRMAA